MRLLVVEDEVRIAEIVKDGLGRAGFTVDVVRLLADAREALALTTYDAAILDLGLPDGDGLKLLAELRPAPNRIPILVLTARDAVEDRVCGLDAGADDYVVKPFAYQEVSARLRALARRAEPGPRRAQPKLSAGAIELDEAARRVTVSGATVDLSPREFSLLEALLRHAGMTLTRDQLLDHAWPFSVAVTPNAVDAYVHYLRTKLGDAGSQIETVRGVGYRLADG